MPVERDATVHQADDVRMAERGENLAFGAEAAGRVGMTHRRRDNLDRYLLREFAIVALGAVHHPHAACADGIDETKRADHAANTGGQIGQSLRLPHDPSAR